MARRPVTQLSDLDDNDVLELARRLNIATTDAVTHGQADVVTAIRTLMNKPGPGDVFDATDVNQTRLELRELRSGVKDPGVIGRIGQKTFSELQATLQGVNPFLQIGTSGHAHNIRPLLEDMSTQATPTPTTTSAASTSTPPASAPTTPAAGTSATPSTTHGTGSATHAPATAAATPSATAAAPSTSTHAPSTTTHAPASAPHSTATAPASGAHAPTTTPSGHAGTTAGHAAHDDEHGHVKDKPAPIEAGDKFWKPAGATIATGLTVAALPSFGVTVSNAPVIAPVTNLATNYLATWPLLGSTANTAAWLASYAVPGVLGIGAGLTGLWTIGRIREGIERQRHYQAYPKTPWKKKSIRQNIWSGFTTVLTPLAMPLKIPGWIGSGVGHAYSFGEKVVTNTVDNWKPFVGASLIGTALAVGGVGLPIVVIPAGIIGGVIAANLMTKEGGSSGGGGAHH